MTRLNERQIEKEYTRILDTDTERSFAWEREPNRELIIPTNLGAGRGRFWHVYRHLRYNLQPRCKIIDFGAYPGTLLRVLRDVAGLDIELTAAGFGFSRDFQTALDKLDVTLLEMEFDARRPSTKFHGLDYPLTKVTTTGFDIAICTEVIEHQMYPLFLLNIINRFVKQNGVVYLTTNSACFIGDIIKLLVGQHNIEEIQHSHVFNDSLWRPHVRLFTLPGLSLLFRLAGFQVEEAYYFDNYEKGRIYKGIKGMGIAIIRKTACVFAHLRSHIFVAAKKVSPPTSESVSIIKRTLEIYGLQDHIHYSDGDH